jgi:hypothetical protein
MKRLIFSLSLLFLINSMVSYGQCTPNTTITIPGIHPDTATNLPAAVIGVPYSADFQFRVLTDTTYLGSPATVQWITVNNIIGLPAGFTFACNPVSCQFNGGTNGCVRISGNPSVSHPVGTYPIRVAISIRGQVTGIPIPITIPDTVDGYRIKIENAAGIGNSKWNPSGLIQVWLNSSSRSLEVSFRSTSAQMVNLLISDILGKPVQSVNLKAIPGDNLFSFPAQNLNSGVYVVSAQTHDFITSRKLVIEKR